MKDKHSDNAAYKKIGFAVAVVCLCFLSALAGIKIGKTISLPAGGSDAADASQRMLRISAAVDQDSSDVIYAEELGGNFDHNIIYSQVKDVMIEINGESMKFEDAIRDGKISTAEIFFYARTDAANGLCVERGKSRHGLSNFVYTYPEFDLLISYDIFETPDGQQHLIDDLGIYSPNTAKQQHYGDYVDEETGYRLDREDWGLTWEPTDASSSGITLDVTQSGGQQIGELTTAYYLLLNVAGKTDGFTDYVESIAHDSVTQLTFDWAEEYGELPSGEYCMRLYIDDLYQDTDVHPLMVNYYDQQYYDIPFSIP